MRAIEGRLVALLLLLVVASPTRAAAPARIVAVGGAVTEIVHALGAGDRLVGVDTTSTHPPEAAALPKVGYQRTLTAEGILSLAPDLLLAGEEAGPPTVLAQIEAAGVPVARLGGGPSLDGLYGRIAAIGDALGRPAEAAALVARMRSEVESLAQALASAGPRPRVLCILSVGRGALMAAGHDTTAETLIALAGGVNAIAGYSGFKPLSPEAVVEGAPDVVLLTARTAELMGGIERIAAVPAIAATPAGRQRRFVAMDGLYLLGFGPRTPQAARELAQHLHGETRAGGADRGR